MICLTSAKVEAGSKLPREQDQPDDPGDGGADQGAEDRALDPGAGGEEGEQRDQAEHRARRVGDQVRRRPARSSQSTMSAILNTSQAPASSPARGPGPRPRDRRAGRRRSAPRRTISAVASQPEDDRPDEPGAERARRRGRGDARPRPRRRRRRRRRTPADRARLDQQRGDLGDQPGEEDQQREAGHLARAEVGGDDHHRDELDQVGDHQGRPPGPRSCASRRRRAPRRSRPGDRAAAFGGAGPSRCPARAQGASQIFQFEKSRPVSSRRRSASARSSASVSGGSGRARRGA